MCIEHVHKLLCEFTKTQKYVDSFGQLLENIGDLSFISFLPTFTIFHTFKKSQSQELLMKKRTLLSTVLLAMLIFSFVLPIEGVTKEESIEKFLEKARVDVQGYSNTPSDKITIKHTTLALEIADILQFDVNNTLDILLFYQKSQNEDGGFGSYPDLNSTWDDTYYGIKGLLKLDLNSSKIKEWNVFSYINTTARMMFYETANVQNITSVQPIRPSLSLIWKWIQYIEMSIASGIIPTVPFEFLTSYLRDLQFDNGSYVNLKTAVFANILLSYLGKAPRDISLASKYIRAFQTSNGAFSWEDHGSPTLNATYFAISALNAMDQIPFLEHKEAIVNFIINLQSPRSGFSEVGGNPNMEDTWKAILVLQMLSKLNELIAPEVLLTEGFVNLDPFPLILVLILIPMLRSKSLGLSLKNNKEQK